jgi:hypothetical protein
MSKSTKAKKHRISPSSGSAKQGPARLVVFIAVVSLIVAGGLWWRHGRDTGPSPVVAASAGSQLTTPPIIPAAAKADLQNLKGNWLRPDGGYVLGIKSVEENGKLEATYLNPKSINVSKAEASWKNGALKVFVELRDVRYPGSTYDLAYEEGKDQLTGIYYHAGLQQQFEVAFVRLK